MDNQTSADRICKEDLHLDNRHVQIVMFGPLCGQQVTISRVTKIHSHTSAPAMTVPAVSAAVLCG